MSSSTANSYNSPNCAQLQFTVQDSERPGHLREYETISRIEKLFSVHLCLSPNHQEPQNEWIILTGCEEDNCKAKRYILALCMPELKLEVTRGGPLFADLLSPENSGLVRNELEYKYQAVVSLLPDGNGVLVKGARNDVLQVSDGLSMNAINGDMSYGGEIRTSEPPPLHLSSAFQSSSYVSDHRPAASADTTSPLPSSSSQDLDQQLRDALQQGVDKFPDHLKKALLDRLQNDSERTPAISTASQPSTLFVHNSSIIPRAVDQKREERIENFVRLGYPRPKVEAVLDSLGIDAADDAILARLVRVCSRTSSANHTRGRSLNTSRPRSSCGEPIATTSSVPVVDSSQLRPIVIDGSNVAMRHGNGRVFSCKGIQLAVDYFKQRGHTQITVFVPEWRKESSRPETPISDQDILSSLEREEILKFTPSRRVQGKRIVSYDDRYVVRLAHQKGGVILSNDQFRDLIEENAEWREVIEQRLIQFTFVDNLLMIPDDPLGKYGPTLDQLLVKDSRDSSAGTRRTGSDKASNVKICPYLDTGCTFGRKCKFYHPDREQQPASSGGSKTPNSSRSATPSPSPDKFYSNKPPLDELKHHSSGNELKLGGEMYPHPSQPSIDISSVSDYLGMVSLQSSPHNPPQQPPPPPESTQTYPVPFSQQAPHKPQYMSLSPPQPQDHHHSLSSPALPSESLPSTPMDEPRPHMHTFPMATLHRGSGAHNTRPKVVTEDLTMHRQPTASLGPSIPPETGDPTRIQVPMDHQYGIPPSSHVTSFLPRGLPQQPPYSSEPYPPQQYGSRGYSTPFHPPPPQPGSNFPQRGVPDLPHRGGPMVQPQPHQAVGYSYNIMEPHHHQHQESRLSGGRWSVDHGTPSSSIPYQGDGYLHHGQHRHQRRLTCDPSHVRTSSSQYNIPPQSQSSSGGQQHSLSHSHSFSQLPTSQQHYPAAARLTGVSEAAGAAGLAYYPSRSVSGGRDGMRYAPQQLQQHQQQQQPNQSEFDFDEKFRLFVTVFPGCEDRIRRVMRDYPNVTDLAEIQSLLQRMN